MSFAEEFKPIICRFSPGNCWLLFWSSLSFPSEHRRPKDKQLIGGSYLQSVLAMHPRC